MTAKIMSSRIRGMSFAEAVTQYAKNRTEWRQHMRNVGDDPDRFQPYPAPQAHPEVERALAEGPDGNSYVPDYIIVDDGPTPGQKLQAKKTEMFQVISQIEQAAAANVIPPMKRRMLDIQVGDIAAADAGRRTEVLRADNERRLQAMKSLSSADRGDIVAINEAVGPQLTEDEINAEIRKLRSDAENSLLDAHLERQARLAAINRHGAQLHHDIDDLTIDTVDDWKPAPFPK